MNMKIIIVLLLVSVVVLAIVPEASAFPGEVRACNTPGLGCHVFPPTSVNITTNITSITVSPGQNFTVGINWSGGANDPVTLVQNAVKWPTNFAPLGIVRDNALFNPIPVRPFLGTNPSGTTSSTLKAPVIPGLYTIRVHVSTGTGGGIPDHETDFKDIAVTVLSPAAVNIIPSTQTVLPNQIFTVNITIDPAGNPTNSVGVDISFNRTLVTVNSVTEGDFLNRGGATNFQPGAIDNGAGTVTNINGNIVAATGNVTTAGTFATITLRANNAAISGISPINLTRAVISSPAPVSQIPATVTNGTVTVAPPALTTITVTPATAGLTAGGAQVFIATAKDQSGAPMAGINITWTSSNTTVGNVTPLNALTDVTGNASTTFNASAAGTSLVNATNGSVRGTASVTVTPAPPVLTTITVTPATAALIVNQAQVFTATARDQNGAPMQGINITWTSSNLTVGNVTPLNALTDATGNASTTFNASAPGTSLVNATNGSVRGTASVIVAPAPPVLTTITVTPATAPLIVNQTQVFNATARDQNGAPMVGINITWTSSNQTVGNVAPLNAITGNDGNASTTFTASAPGTALVNATNGSVRGTSSVLVTTAPPVLTTITVTPATAVLFEGDTQNFTAAPKDQFGNAFQAIVTWTSNNTAVGIINATTGVFTALAPGTTIINATNVTANGTVVGNATVTVKNKPPVVVLNFPPGGSTINASSPNLAAFLQGSQETPPNPSTATGNATFSIDTVANTLTFNITFRGLQGNFRDAHIHGPAGIGVPAGILFNLTPFVDLPNGTINGVWNYTDANKTNETRILSGLTYVNIHSLPNFGGGEIRGQIVNTSIDFNWTSTDVSPPILSNLTIDGVVVERNIPTTNGTPALRTIAGLPEGSHTWSVTSQDALNLSSTPVTNTFTIDTKAPSVIVSSPVNGSTVNIFNRFVAGNITDASVLSSATLTVGIPQNIWTTKGTFARKVTYTAGQPNTVDLTVIDAALPVGNMNTTILQVNVNPATHTENVTVNASQPVSIDARNNTSTMVNFVSTMNGSANISITAAIAPPAGKNITNLTSNQQAVANLVDLGKYINITFNADANVTGNVSSRSISLNYLDFDLDMNSNGVIGEAGIDVDEASLSLYMFNASTSNWTKIATGIDAVNNALSASLTSFSDFGVAGTILAAPVGGGGGTPAGGGGSTGGGTSGGGGGGGGASGENFTNVMLREKYDEAVFKNRVTSYKFKNASNPITQVDVTGNINAGLITAMVEVLKGTSTLVSEVPPGIVNKNINLWLGTSGFAVPKNIKEVVIRFRVENSWMQSNNVDPKDIKMLKWDSTSKRWMTLKTEVKEKVGTVTFFEATANSLSPLAISAVTTPPGGPVAGGPPAATPPAPGETPGKPTAPKPKGTPGFEIAAAIAAISALYVVCRKIRR